MSELSNLDQIDITGKKVFLRVDFNVPLIEGKIISDIRTIEAIPTIKLILSKEACNYCAILQAKGKNHSRAINIANS